MKSTKEDKLSGKQRVEIQEMNPKLAEKEKIIQELKLEIDKLKIKLMEQEALFDKQRFKLADANLNIMKETESLEEQKFKLAEANLNIMEQNELLEEQKQIIAEANLNLLEKNEIIRKEQEKSEKLLLNVLPIEVVKELRETGKTKPECFDDVSVLFSDIVDFTKLSSSLDPKLLINELSDIFTAFDYIIEKNKCERIKTIGDAYLCVCGMPQKDENHAENIVKSSIEMINYLQKRNENSEIEWNIRVGIHSGKVVGGVVGKKKYIYDVFGDTMNIASRIESKSEPMRINVSEVTYNLLKDKFDFITRDLIEVKGKGKMRMYFVNGIL